MAVPTLINELGVSNELGEGILWDARRECVWWTDIQRCKLYAYSPRAMRVECFNTPERLACFSPVENEEFFVAAFASGFAYFNPHTGDIERICPVEDDLPATRLNDGRCDRQGRFWAGSLVEGDGNSDVTGALYCLDRQQQCTRKLSNLVISNGLCWSPDSRVMYHTDTTTARIDRYAFDPSTATVGERSTFVVSDDGCSPDGACVDAAGFLWSAQWGGGKVCRYSPDGALDLELDIPASQPTCVTFGGPNLTELYVTSARQDLDEEALSTQPSAGNVFVFETPYKGIEDSAYLRLKRSD